MIDGAGPICNIMNFEDNIEFTIFKISYLTESICHTLLNKKPERNKAKQLYTEHFNWCILGSQ